MSDQFIEEMRQFLGEEALVEWDRLLDSGYELPHCQSKDWTDEQLKEDKILRFHEKAGSQELVFSLVSCHGYVIAGWRDGTWVTRRLPHPEEEYHPNNETYNQFMNRFYEDKSRPIYRNSPDI